MPENNEGVSTPMLIGIAVAVVAILLFIMYSGGENIINQAPPAMRKAPLRAN